MDKIGTAVREGASKTSSPEELLNSRESALNFAVLAEQRINDLTATGTNPPELANLESLVLKLNEVANRPEGRNASPINLALGEQKELIPLMGKYKQGSDAVKAGEGFMPNADLETVVRVMALHPAQSEIAGILALDDSKAQDRVSRALKLYAFKKPVEYMSIINNLSTARNFVKDDWKVLSPVFARMEQFGIDRGTAMGMLDLPDWRNQLTGLIDARMQGTSPAIKDRWRAWRASADFTNMHDVIELYRARAPERTRFTTEIGAALKKVFLEEGVAGRVLTQEALQPDAPPESRQAYDALQTARLQMNTMMNNPAAFGQSLQSRFSTDPRWALRNDPVRGQIASRSMARDWLDQGYRDNMNATTNVGQVGGMWTRILMGLITTLFGTAYGASEVNNVANRIRGL